MCSNFVVEVYVINQIMHLEDLLLTLHVTGFGKFGLDSGLLLFFFYQYVARGPGDGGIQVWKL